VRIDAIGSGDDMNICNPSEQPLCHSLNYTNIIHIELTLSMSCGNASIQNNIQCDLDEGINAVLTDVVGVSTAVRSCIMVKDSEMSCRALISVLEDSTVSQTLTRQLFEQLVSNKTLMMVSIT